ncbi:PPOX class F420-dependent oxidoreductase [Mycobacterium sp. 236(2023)]|uniref:PPOX class F420-dependent oxidoreductase n=1 Tax=Mycobacterium sp. 236(2023) TaxID=3038163 RepID=UPI0024152B47|nr:PPOX class F420-dependent oxidoreductase [Mycobacterium sp. 236(2023)]MDG4667448.1 PPOX class F420-dependent oxidoreductase [Mycobacterium sp. 236(2023)]
MAFDLHPDARALIEARPGAHLVTMRPDGRPHVSFIWIDITDDGQIQFATPPWRVKGKNLRKDPACVLSIQDDQKADNGLLRHLLIEGVATIDDDPHHGQEFLDRLFYKYTGGTSFEGDDGGQLLITVVITRVSGVGPWHTGKTTSIGTPI